MKILPEKNIHCIGIGGIGLSALAQILKSQNKNISGSDLSNSELIEDLQKTGITVFKEHKDTNLTEKTDLVIYSQAIPDTNPELIEAKKRGIKTMTYPEALGELTKNFKTIAIAGTHGKSTTTGIMSLIAIEGGIDPTIVIGTKMKELGNKNYRIGKSEHLIIEACEYKRSFLSFKPNILIITNIEAEHLDYFKDEKNYNSAFKELSNNLSKEDFIIINSDDKNSFEVTKESQAQIIKWSRGDQEKNKLIENTLELIDKSKIEIKPSVPGKFNIENATFAAIAGNILGIESEKISKGIRNFSGTWRRMEHKTVKLDAKFIDDYAHHPTEIRETLKAIREEYSNEKILVIFQPHQYSRTKSLIEEFAKSFGEVDQVIITDIYEVRDSQDDINSVSVNDLVQRIEKNGTKAINGNGIEKSAKLITEKAKEFDLIVTMGAGNISSVYNYF